MNEPIQRRPATTIGELDLHLSYTQAAVEELRAALGKLLEAVSSMATKQDIDRLEERMTAFVTKDELAAVEARLQAGSVPSTFDRWISTGTKIGAFAAVVAAACGGFAAFVHFLDRVPK